MRAHAKTPHRRRRRACCCGRAAAAAQTPVPTRVLTHREQAPLKLRWVEQRFKTLLPALMRRTGIDMWIIVSREYNDDPVFASMAPVTTYSSRRRTILVFFDRGGRAGVEHLSIGRFDYDGLFTLERTDNDGQWEALRRVVESRNPKVIGIDVSEDFNHADGLTANERDNLMKALGPKFTPRVKSAEALAVGWLESKLPEETDAYRDAMRVAHDVIRAAFSNQVIVPGVTTNEDVAWWMRQRVAELGLGQWFHPTITVYRKGGLPDPGSSRRRRHSARRHAPLRFRHRLHGLLHRHPAQRVRAAAGRDGCTAGAEGRPQGGQSPAGSDAPSREAWCDRQPGAGRRACASQAGRADAFNILPSDRVPRPRCRARRSA